MTTTTTYYICKEDPVDPGSWFLQPDGKWGKQAEKACKFSSVAEAIAHLPTPPPTGHIWGDNCTTPRRELNGQWVTPRVWRAGAA